MTHPAPEDLLAATHDAQNGLDVEEDLATDPHVSQHLDARPEPDEDERPARRPARRLYTFT